MEPEVCVKMLINLSENLAAKFPATALRYSMVKIARLDAFSEIFELEASPVEDRSLQREDKNRRKRKGKNTKLKNRKA